MGLYNVVEPCVAGDVQYVRPTVEFQPVFVDDEVAAPLVGEGKITAYLPGGDPEPTGENPVAADDPKGEAAGDPAAARRRPRRSESDES